MGPMRPGDYCDDYFDLLIVAMMIVIYYNRLMVLMKYGDGDHKRHMVSPLIWVPPGIHRQKKNTKCSKLDV